MRALIAVVAGALLLAGCGGGDGDDDPEADDTFISIDAASVPDQRLGEDLVAYIDRNYPPETTLGDLLKRLPPRVRAAYRELRAGADRTLQNTIETIDVEDGVFILETNLEPGAEGRQGAEFICTVVMGADVADFEDTEILDAEGEELYVCAARDA